MAHFPLNAYLQEIPILCLMQGWERLRKNKHRLGGLSKQKNRFHGCTLSSPSTPSIQLKSCYWGVGMEEGWREKKTDSF